MPNTPLKVGVIGYGYSAKTFHLPFIDTLESLTLSALALASSKWYKQIGHTSPTLIRHSGSSQKVMSTW